MTAVLVKQPIVWVENDNELNAWCERWQGARLLAIDTEFMRSQTYFPIAALIQVNDGENNVLIDPTRITDFSYLAELMTSDSILKAIHSCSEDLEVFYRILGVIPTKLFDTQIAASALGYGFSVGYANLVRFAMDIELPKSETRSDWLQRPLSQAQVHYAAIDVEYLFFLAERFIVELETQKRFAWVEEECEGILRNYVEMQLSENAFLRFKSAWKLDEQQLACLMRLAEWRERTAQDRDVPRNRVIKENALFQIAMRQPNHISQLRKYEGVNERMLRADGETLINLVKQAQDLAPDELPVRISRPPGGAENRIIKALRERVVEFAEALNVAPELLLKKKDYEQLVKSLGQLPSNLKGWRKDIIGEQLLAWYQELIQDSKDDSEEVNV